MSPTEPAFTSDEIAAGEALFNRPWQFVKSVPELQFLPDADRHEIAFAGRSNVGKSSLINALVKRRGLARTSNTPGRTQELNYFERPEVALYLVDMPGYGFAKAPKEVARKWRFLVNDYLRGRQVLKRALVLIDSRHGVKEIDREIMQMLDDAAVSYRVVLTKADKIKASELADVTAATGEEARRHPAAHPEIIVTSSEKGLGMDRLRAAVLEAALL